MIEKIVRLNFLFDAYKNLLTKKQVEYFELYFFEDLSLREIGNEYQISRNAVFVNIKNTIKLLESYEIKLNLVSKQEQANEIYKQLLDLNNDVVTQEINNLIKIYTK